MSYKALYRTYRPLAFRDVVGQRAIVKALKNQIISGRIAHAYLFNGPRGVGKTSIAKIFARAVNCHHPIEGEACGECPSCLALESEISMDVLEIDAASNNGVDHIRELRENISYLPVNGRYRVYIVDEVHMLSSSAFNALLKTLEEPPGHVIFLLATTDPQKLPETVLSRCQRYDFTRISTQDISERLNLVLQELGITADEKAVTAIARSSEGGLRDALSLLDQCLALGGDRLTAQDVYSMLGTVDVRYYFALIEAILSGDTGRSLNGLNAMFEMGCGVSVIVSQLMGYFRDLFLVLCAGADSIDGDDVTRAWLAKYSQTATQSIVLHCLSVLSGLESNLRFAAQPRLLTELAIARCSHRAEAEDTVSLLGRIEQLEKQVNRLLQSPASQVTAVSSPEEPIHPVSVDSQPIDRTTDTAIPAAEELPPWEAPPPDYMEQDIPLESEFPAVSPTTSAGISSPEEQELGMTGLKNRLEAATQNLQPSDDALTPQSIWKKVIQSMLEQKKNMLVSTMQEGNAVSLQDGVFSVVFPPGKQQQQSMLSTPRNIGIVSNALTQLLGKRVTLRSSMAELTDDQQEFVEKSLKALKGIRNVSVELPDQS